MQFFESIILSGVKMKSPIHILAAFFCFIAVDSVFAQNSETINHIDISAVPTKSYTVNEQGRLLPGFSIKASVNGAFFLRANAQGMPVPSPNSNFVRTEAVLTPTSAIADLTTLSVTDKSTTYEYFDGLGRTTQKVNVQSSPTQKDVVSFSAYDVFGNQPKQYLSYTVGNGNGVYRSNASGEQSSFYQTPPSGVVSDSEPFSINVYDNTPNNELKEVYKPGADWHPANANKSTKTTSRFNASSEIVEIAYNGTDLPYNNGTYTANMLVITETIDEVSLIKRSYKNFNGQLLIERVGDGTTWLDTYYLYDWAGNLTYVLPPEAASQLMAFTGTITDKQALLDRLAFQYQYDEEQRVKAKRVPGSIEGVNGWTYVIYDQWNRVVLVQDAAQHSRNEYTFTKYDRFNRPMLSGLYTTTTDLATLRTNVASATVRFETETANATGYTLTATFPTDIVESNLLTVNYYDNYTFLTYTGWDAEANSYAFSNVTDYIQNTSLPPSVKGYVTGSKVRVLGQSTWLNSVTYYDRKYRPVQTINEIHKGGVLRTTSDYHFSGRLRKEQIYNSLSVLTIQNDYDYDHAGRLRTLKHSINGATPVLMSSNQYNELGQLMEKNIHSTDNGVSFLQSIDSKYNIQGKRTGINNSALTPEAGDTNTDLFGMEFQYNPATVSNINNGAFTTKKYYNGNISAVRWKTDTKQGTAVEQMYGFDYDIFNRMKQAYYASNNTGTWNGNGGMFDEQIKNYDKNGNIKGILRNGNVQGSKTAIDDLTFSYTLSGKDGNRLTGVDDASTNSLGFKAASTSLTEEYQYDYNGNLKFDFNKSISQIDYNHLNLPTSIQFTRSDGTVDKIEYVYDASGKKLKKTVKVNGNLVWWTDYVGNAQYDKDQLSFFSTPEGRVVNNNGSYEYEYFHKDHLGNVRVGYGPLKETVSYRATMENPSGSNLASQEEATFSNVATTRSNPADPTFNYTPSSEKVLLPNRAAQCNGFTSKSIGPAKDLRVLNGDVVYMEVYAKYWNVAVNSSTVITNLVSTVNGSFTIPNPTEAATFAQQLASYLPSASAAITTTAVVPKAYLMWLFFDDNYVYQRSGAQAIGTNAYRAFEKLSKSFTADKNGHLFIYVANESSESAAIDVYFDELYIMHQKTNTGLQVTQASDYYPFGLSFNQYQADRLNQSSNGVYTPTLRNRNLFQGQELQKDLDLNWYQFEARMYDAALGRFGGVDPLTQKMTSQSPYNFVLNNPIYFVDPDGRWHQPFPEPYFNPNLYKMQDRAMQQYVNNNFNALWGIQNNRSSYEASFMSEWQSRLDHLQGDYKRSYSSYAEEWASGDAGLLRQGLSVISSLNPLSGIAKGFLDARNGDYGSAALNFGTSLTELGSVARTTKSISSLEPLASDTRTLYRAVSQAEQESIQSTGGFSSTATSMPGKWFANDANDAAMWGKSFYHWDKEPISIVEVKVPISYTGYDLSYGAGFDGSKFGGVYISDLPNFNSNTISINFFNSTPIPH